MKDMNNKLPINLLILRNISFQLLLQMQHNKAHKNRFIGKIILILILNLKMISLKIPSLEIIPLDQSNKVIAF